MRKGIRLKSSQVVSLLQYETCVLLSIILRLFCPVLGTFDVILPTREVQVVLGKINQNTEFLVKLIRLNCLIFSPIKYKATILFCLQGMSREIAYIRNGKINTNAAKFVIPVSQDLDAVHLAWRMRPNSNRGAGDNTDSTTVSYRIFIESTTTSSAATSRSAEDAMYQPSLNVSHQGRLSIKEEIVRISLPCTGRVHATVDVDITIHFEVSNMDDQDSSNIELNLKRQKTCTTENTHNGMHGHDGADQEWHTNGKPDVTFLAIILSAFIIMIFTILFIVIVNWKGCEFIFGIAISNDKTTATTTTISSNPNKNNAHFLVCHNIDHKFSHQTGVNNEDITNPYEAIMTQNQPLIQEPNVLTYNDAGLLTMDPRSGGALSSMQLSEQPPLPPLPPPMSANQHYMRNCVGTRGVGGVFTGNKFEFVTADFNSDAESRVTDWVNQHQKQHETLNTVDRGFNVVEAHDQRGKTEHASLAANYPDENDNASGDDNVNERAEMLFENLQVDRHRLKLGCLLQEGTFGRVYQVRSHPLPVWNRIYIYIISKHILIYYYHSQYFKTRACFNLQKRDVQKRIKITEMISIQMKIVVMT